MSVPLRFTACLLCSVLTVLLQADATGGGGFIEEAHDDPYSNFFQVTLLFSSKGTGTDNKYLKSSQQSLPSPSPGFRLPPLFLALRLWNVVSRRRPPPDESVPQECSKCGFFSRRARSNWSQEPAIMIPKQPVPEGKGGEGEGEQRETVDDRSFAYDSLSATKNKSKQRDDPSDNVQSPPSYDRTLPAHLDSKDSRGLWERLIQARGKSLTLSFLHSSTSPPNAPQPTLRNPQHWNSSLFPLESSRRTVDVFACRDEDRYGIAPESDAEAAVAMLRTNDDVASSSTRPGRPAMAVHVSQGQPTQIQASTSGPEEIALCDVLIDLHEQYYIRPRCTVTHSFAIVCKEILEVLGISSGDSEAWKKTLAGFALGVGMTSD
ncbi:hypothetical protein F4604DRAFT_1684855 [Suillus subluteus]|nr:hypothetical protein F4604DRAFT_1684855 [Suillus subluteus]